MPRIALYSWPQGILAWPAIVVLLVAAVRVDRKVSRRQNPPKSHTAAMAIIVAGVILTSIILRLSLPSTWWLLWLWPIVAIPVTLHGIRARERAIDAQPPLQFNADLDVFPGQVVVQTDVYAVVRHPGYRGELIYDIGFVLLIGLWPLLVLAVVALPIVFRARILKEEKINQAEMAGYAGYMDKVRWRLIRHVW